MMTRPPFGMSLLESEGALDAPANGASSGFYWPSPHYAIYSDESLWDKPQFCEVEDLNKTTRRCLLTSIIPAEQRLVVQIPPRKVDISLAFSQFRRLTLKTPIQPEDLITDAEFSDILGGQSTVQYHLHLKHGHSVSGQTVGYVETHLGLFLFTPLNTRGSLERVFIPIDAFQKVSFDCAQ